MSAPDRERGAALVVTLIFTTAMAAAAVAFLAGRQTDALTMRGQLQAVEAQAMLDAALQQTVALLANKTPRQVVPARLTWRFGEVEVAVTLEQESGKVDLNSAEDPLLRALPIALGLDEDRAAALADMVQDWRDDNQLKLELGAEDRDYRGGPAGVGGAADRPLANPAELLYLPALDRSLWAAMQPYVTVYSGAAQPEPRQAATAVRRALEIARGLERDEPPQEERGEPATAGADADASGRAGEGALGAGTPVQRAEAGRLRGSAARASSLSRRETAQERRRSRGGAESGDGVSEADAQGAAGAAGAGEDDGPRTFLLQVRFPNGYRAAARTVVALQGGGASEEGPPFVVLAWTPVLRAVGAGS